MRTIKVKEWSYRGRHAGWQFNCGRNEKGKPHQWRIGIEGFPTIEDAQAVAQKVEAYWQQLRQKGLQAWTPDHEALAKGVVGIWPTEQTADMSDRMQCYFVEEQQKARWHIEQEEKAKRDAERSANQLEVHARQQALKAVNVTAAVDKHSIYYVVEIDLYLLKPPPFRLQLCLCAPRPTEER